MSEVKQTVRKFILDKFLPGAQPDELEDTTPLIKGGILDSLATVTLVTFLEQTYGIRIEAHEADEDNLGTLDDIGRLVTSKLK